TVATNTALERDGAKMAIVVTAGHKDVLVVGRGNRMSVYNIKAPPNRPLVARSQCIEVRERMRVDGTVLIPLDQTEVDAIAGRLAARPASGGYADPLHAVRAGRWRDRRELRRRGREMSEPDHVRHRWDIRRRLPGARRRIRHDHRRAGRNLPHQDPSD